MAATGCKPVPQRIVPTAQCPPPLAALRGGAPKSIAQSLSALFGCSILAAPTCSKRDKSVQNVPSPE